MIATGSALYDTTNPEDFTTSTVTVPLAGTPITINFTVDLIANYVEPIYGDTIANYIATNVLVTVGAPAPLGAVGAPQSNNPNNFIGFADYTGNGQGGHFYSTGSLIGYEPDYYQTVDFTFANAGGVVSGSGSAFAGFYEPAYLTYDRYNLTFAITGGTITAVPEPAAWALLIAGFVAVGAMMRRRGRMGFPNLG